ncbi:hypothetical protein HYW35_03300 [Candidatus Saccharibacteria bacterium]|nr:hypothetical protein [Candidatus Saccharibacteria bacterium]
MKCIYCGGETEVTNSRAQKRSNQIWRRRQCLHCKSIFTTHEAIELSSSLFVEAKGSPKPFLTDLLFTEVLLALQDRKNCYVEAREITSTVIRQLLSLPDKPLLKPHQISEVTANVLKHFNRRAWLRYVAEHDSLQGPALQRVARL